MKVFFLFIVFALSAKTWSQQPPYVIGRNDDTIRVGRDEREFVVHVPRGYVAGTRLPVVFMLHGTSGDGPRFYDISGWKELGDSLNIITVYPSSWRYCYIKDGDTATSTKWVSYDLVLCRPNQARNDVLFLNNLLDKLNRQVSIDTNRVYLVGFSNGGEMASRVAVELSHRFAAVVSEAGALPGDTVCMPRRLLPVTLMIGNEDDRAFGSSILPMDFLAARAAFPQLNQLIDTYTQSFALDTNYTPINLSNGRIIGAKYPSLSGDPKQYWQFIFVQGLDHHYPNGKNHWLYGAAAHWTWLKNFRLH